MVAKFKGHANSDVDGFDVAVSQWDSFAPSYEAAYNVLVMGKEDRRGRNARDKGVHWDC